MPSVHVAVRQNTQPGCRHRAKSSEVYRRFSRERGSAAYIDEMAAKPEGEIPMRFVLSASILGIVRLGGDSFLLRRGVKLVTIFSRLLSAHRGCPHAGCLG